MSDYRVRYKLATKWCEIIQHQPIHILGPARSYCLVRPFQLRICTALYIKAAVKE